MASERKILIVDDDIDCREQVSMILRGYGYDVITAASQAEGEEILLRTQPSLAVLDLMMEEMDSGFVLCHTIKKLYPDLPVILLTGVTAATGMSFKTQDARARRWIEADVMLDKPVRPEELRNAVAKLLEA
ncbi:MAG: response regulator [Candidatus Krumholzibacteria bacterium]|nr:response regulator [Candidatus Krumholzibacteria bacterium]